MCPCHPPPTCCRWHGQSEQESQLPVHPGQKTRERQAWRFIPERFCFYDALLSQPDRMRNKYHQNTTREAILEVFIAQPQWKMFGHLPRKPILTVFPSPFLNFWALTQTESGLFEVCLSLFTRASCSSESREGSWGQGCDEEPEQLNTDGLCWCCREEQWYPPHPPNAQMYPLADCLV